MARKAVEAASEKQASDIVLLDIHEACSFADYFIICSGESKRQLQAIWDEIAQALKRDGVKLHHCEGTADSGWILLDFGDVVVHIFDPIEREFYQLDRLWSSAVPLLRVQ